MNSNNKTNRKNKRKKKSVFTIKKFLLLAIVIACVAGGVKIGFAYKNEQEALQEEKIKKEELAKELEEKEESQVVVGQKKEFKDVHGIDSQKVWNAMNTYDYDNGGKKEVFLTFDDGPSLTNTPNIIKILKGNNVKGTFFVIGKSLKMDGAPAILKDLYNEGMAIGNHSFSHDYAYLYPKRVLNLENFTADFKENEKLIKKSLEMDNFSTRVIRCPGGQISWKSTEPLNDYLIKNNMASIDWNALNGDAEGGKKNADQLYQEAVNSGKGKNLVVILMHDTYGKEETVKALDKIIKHYKSEGYEFKTLV